MVFEFHRHRPAMAPDHHIDDGVSKRRPEQLNELRTGNEQEGIFAKNFFIHTVQLFRSPVEGNVQVVMDCEGEVFTGRSGSGTAATRTVTSSITLSRIRSFCVPGENTSKILSRGVLPLLSILVIWRFMDPFGSDRNLVLPLLSPRVDRTPGKQGFPSIASPVPYPTLTFAIYYSSILVLQRHGKRPEPSESEANRPDAKHLHEIPPVLREMHGANLKNG
jgi:hypothetical protein